MASPAQMIGKIWTLQEDAVLMSLHHVDENGRLSRGLQSLADMVKSMREQAPHYGIVNSGVYDEYTVFNVQQRLHHHLLPLYRQHAEHRTTAEILAQWRLLTDRHLIPPFKRDPAANAELMESPTGATGPPGFEKACEIKKGKGVEEQ